MHNHCQQELAFVEYIKPYTWPGSSESIKMVGCFWFPSTHIAQAIPAYVSCTCQRKLNNNFHTGTNVLALSKNACACT